ncbi:MAG: helix-hairpin-helix domain-containing protein [Lentimicrobiaceae bacterium]|jgi:DNA uptake protein ComE-like DNA-binding protein|nr:helix-hairpin-helix domain-containing protein [Lentimicrobiaceae bacterium]
MEEFKNSFYFTKNQRIAITAICILLLLVVLFYFFPTNHFGVPKKEFHDLDSIYRLQAQAKNEALAKQKTNFDPITPEESAAEVVLTPFYFNPNMLPESEWKKIGLSDRQIRNIKNYEQKGGKFYRKEDLKKLYSISEAEYKVLEPYILIPEHKKQPIKTETKKKAKEQAVTTYEIPENIELNTADSSDLIRIPGIRPWIAHRILKYKYALGGFYDKKQLLEVYQIDSVFYTKIEHYFSIDTMLIQKRRINFETFKELLSHPYISYETTKSIVNQRERYGMIQNWNDFQSKINVKEHKNVFLKPYLQYD